MSVGYLFVRESGGSSQEMSRISVKRCLNYIGIQVSVTFYLSVSLENSCCHDYCSYVIFQSIVFRKFECLQETGIFPICC